MQNAAIIDAGCCKV